MARTTISKGQLFPAPDLEYFYDVKKDELYRITKKHKSLLLKGPLRLDTHWKSKGWQIEMDGDRESETRVLIAWKYNKIWFDEGYQANCFRSVSEMKNDTYEIDYCQGIGIAAIYINGEKLQEIAIGKESTEAVKP